MANRGVRRGRILTFPLHERLRIERENAGLRQEDVAEKLGWTQDKVSRAENGKIRVPGDVLPAYAQILGVTVARLFDEHRFERPQYLKAS